MAEKKRITLRLPNEVAEELRNINDEFGISMNTLILMGCLEAAKADQESLNNDQQSSDMRKLSDY